MGWVTSNRKPSTEWQEIRSQVIRADIRKDELRRAFEKHHYGWEDQVAGAAYYWRYRNGEDPMIQLRSGGHINLNIVHEENFEFNRQQLAKEQGLHRSISEGVL